MQSFHFKFEIQAIFCLFPDFNPASVFDSLSSDAASVVKMNSSASFLLYYI